MDGNGTVSAENPKTNTQGDSCSNYFILLYLKAQISSKKMGYLDLGKFSVPDNRYSHQFAYIAYIQVAHFPLH